MAVLSIDCARERGDRKRSIEATTLSLDYSNWKLRKETIEIEISASIIRKCSPNSIPISPNPSSDDEFRCDSSFISRWCEAFSYDGISRSLKLELGVLVDTCGFRGRWSLSRKISELFLFFWILSEKCFDLRLWLFLFVSVEKKGLFDRKLVREAVSGDRWGFLRFFFSGELWWKKAWFWLMEIVAWWSI